MKINKRYLILSGAFLILIFAYFIFRSKVSGASLTAIVKKSNFEVIVTNTGELRSKNYTEVMAPTSELRNLGIWQIKITNLVPEGTTVKEGDFVADLDKTEIMTKVNEEQLNVNKRQSEYTQTKLDTTLTMRDARDELLNLKYAVEEKKLVKDQSIYEPPAVLRQAEIDYEKAVRAYEQKQENYKTKREQSITKMQIVGSDLEKAKSKLDALLSILQKLTVKAPKGGMVIYKKDWDGKKVIVGSTVGWDATVANLPDLTTMESVTYVNEVDIQKIKTGQKVNIGLDAQPGKKLLGIIKSVASIGEQKANSEAKVFEVVIDVISKDTTLRPSMTTANSIVTSTIGNVLSIPIEAIQNAGNKSFVYKKSGSKIVKQQIKTGVFNENSAVVSEGLIEQDEVFVSLPSDTSGAEFIFLTPETKK
jgi:Cu/Ag efflux protein CusF